MMLFYICASAIALWLLAGRRLTSVLALRRLSAALCAALALCHGLSARETAADSIRTDKFRPTQLIAPAVLIAVGSMGVSGGWFCSVKEDVRKGLHEFRGERRCRVDDYLQYLPVAANLGLGFVGVKAKHPFRERLAVTATAYAAMGLVVNVTKIATREKRPGSNAYNSFPSGHTATAFMGAELVRAEYGNWYGLGAYTLAAGIAFMRLYNDRHWLNDVLAGAGTGILSARIGYWLLPCERKLFRWDKTATPVSVLPAYNPLSQSASISLAMTF